MALMPGAAWRPVPVAATRPKRTKGRGVCLHVAVTEATSLFGYFSTADVDAHFYVARNGAIEQYVDTELEAYAQLDGNATLISVETQGGVTNPESEPWTAEQVAALARICRWAHDIEGVPLQLMPDSRPTSRGIGWHRLGVNPWVVSGGELWSSSYGKTCPGATKITQVPSIIQHAQNGADDMPLTADDLWQIENRAYAATRNLFYDMIAGSAPAARNAFDGLVKESVQPLIPAPSSTAATVDASAVAAALATNQQFLSAVAKAVTDTMSARLHS
jgi:hypothetical protein